MKLNEVAKKAADGTYMAVKFDKDTCDALKEFVEKLKVPNRIARDKLHTTIIYSRKHAPDLKANNDLYPIKAKGKELHIFQTQDKKNALVLKLDCDKLLDRHNEIMAEHQTTYDFPEYIPHITLSYDCGDFDPEAYEGDLPKELVIAEEYVEDLVLDWQNTWLMWKDGL